MVAVVTCGVSTLRIVPPLTIQTDLVDSALDIPENTVNDGSKRNLNLPCLQAFDGSTWLSLKLGSAN